MSKILAEGFAADSDRLPVRLYESYSQEDGVIYIVDFYNGNQNDKIRYNWIVAYKGISLEIAERWYKSFTENLPL